MKSRNAGNRNLIPEISEIDIVEDEDDYSGIAGSVFNNDYAAGTNKVIF